MAPTQKARRIFSLLAYALVGAALVGAAGAFVVHRRVSSTITRNQLTRFRFLFIMCFSLTQFFFSHNNQSGKRPLRN